MLVTHDGCERITQHPGDLESPIVHDKRAIKAIKGLVARKAVNIQ